MHATSATTSHPHPHEERAVVLVVRALHDRPRLEDRHGDAQVHLLLRVPGRGNRCQNRELLNVRYSTTSGKAATQGRDHTVDAQHPSNLAASVVFMDIFSFVATAFLTSFEMYRLTAFTLGPRTSAT